MKNVILTIINFINNFFLELFAIPQKIRLSFEILRKKYAEIQKQISETASVKRKIKSDREKIRIESKIQAADAKEALRAQKEKAELERERLAIEAIAAENKRIEENDALENMAKLELKLQEKANEQALKEKKAQAKLETKALERSLWEKMQDLKLKVSEKRIERDRARELKRKQIADEKLVLEREQAEHAKQIADERARIQQTTPQVNTWTLDGVLRLAKQRWYAVAILIAIGIYLLSSNGLLVSFQKNAEKTKSLPTHIVYPQNSNDNGQKPPILKEK